MRLAGLPEGNGRDMVWISRGWRALVNSRDANLGLCLGLGLRTNALLRVRTVADFPTRRGRLRARVRTLETLYCEAFLGYPKLRWPLPLSTSPLEGSFHTRGNWRGPVWPVIAWPPWWSLRRAGDEERAETLAWFPRRRSPRGGGRVLRAPFIGEDLGSDDQPWTTAVTPDWLVDGV